MNMGTYKNQDPNGSMNSAVSGNRKPTADSTAYAYKPNGKNNRPIFSSGGSIDDASPQIGFNQSHFPNTHVDKLVNNYNTNHTKTASRFYNPNK